jgi:tripartite-type tricarboxylate transporter receptor subunit TctC
MKRRDVLAVALAMPFAARADAPYPNQPIKIVVPYPPGGLTDVAARMIGERLQSALGQPVIVDNKAGAGTQIGAAYVAKQPADGYTLLLATVSTLCITPVLYAKPMIAAADFAGISRLGFATLILIVRPGLDVADPKALIELLHAKPGTYSFGSPGIGTAHHLLAELMLSRGQASAVHVPYPGSVKAMLDLAEGRIDFMFLDATVVMPQVAAGKVKAIAVTGTKRQAALPDVPALIEFFPGLDQESWLSVAAPAGTPQAVLERLNGEINRALDDKSITNRLAEAGLEVAPMTVAAFGDFVKREAERWGDMVKISGAKAE